MIVRAVDLSEVQTMWPRVADHVAAALEYGKGRFTLERIHDDLVAGRKRLWVAEQDGGVLAAVVTCLTNFPAMRVCTMLLCGGEDVDSWVARIKGLIEEYARWEDCAQVEIIGRRGWHLKCPDYELAGVWLVKDMNAQELAR